MDGGEDSATSAARARPRPVRPVVLTPLLPFLLLASYGVGLTTGPGPDRSSTNEPVAHPVARPVAHDLADPSVPMTMAAPLSAADHPAVDPPAVPEPVGAAAIPAGLDAPMVAPQTPAGFSVFPSPGGVLVLWDAVEAVPAVDGYRLQRATNPAFTGATTYTLSAAADGANLTSGLSPGTTYHWRIAAHNADGTGTYSATMSAASGAAPGPAAPTGTIEALVEAVRVDWEAPAVAGILGYVVMLQDDAGTYRYVEVDAGVTSHSFGGLLAGDPYWAYVATRTASGVGAFSPYLFSRALAAATPACVGAGSDGPRVEVLYASAPGTPAIPDWRLAQVDGFDEIIDRAVSESAAATGGARRLRWRTDTGTTGCEIVVTPVEVPATVQTLSQLISEVDDEGFTTTVADRKFFLWVDPSVSSYANGCVAQFQPDDSPGQGNASNTVSGFGACPVSWGEGYGPLHEIMHLFGAVQPGSPSSDGGAHCTDWYDPLCSNSHGPVLPDCASTTLLYRYDCHHDDYFNTQPAPGSYLCTHWNTARSRWLVGHLDESLPGAPGAPTATATAGGAEVTVSPPASLPCDGITGYRVTASPGGTTVSVSLGGDPTAPPATTTIEVDGLAPGTTYTFRVQAVSVSGPGARSAPSGSVVPPVPAAGGFHPVTPVRILDTRPGPEQVGLAGAFGPAQSRRLAVPGVGVSATAVVLNVTGIAGASATHLSLTPEEPGPGGPVTSNLNLPAGGVRPNLVTVKLDGALGVWIYNNSGATHVLADLVGWYDDGTASGDRLTAIDPARILDTRPGPDQTGLAGRFQPAQGRRLQVAGHGGVPASGVSAVVLNLTGIVASGSSTHLSVTPVDPAGHSPATSNVNLAALGDVIPNLAVVSLDDTGGVWIWNNSSEVDALADVVGYYGEAGAGRVTAVTPSRVLDTRPPPDEVGLAGAFGGPQKRRLQVTGVGGVPTSGVIGVWINVTGVGPTATTHLSLTPDEPPGTASPPTSNLNLPAGVVRPNLVFVQLDETGGVWLFNNSGSVHVIGDVVAYVETTV